MKNKYLILLFVSLILNLWQYFSVSQIERATLGGWKSTGEPYLKDKELIGFIDNRKNCQNIGKIDQNKNILIDGKNVGKLEWVFIDKMKIVNDSGKVFYYRRVLF